MFPCSLCATPYWFSTLSALPLIIFSHTPSPNKGVFKPFKPLERMFGEQTLECYRWANTSLRHTVLPFQLCYAALHGCRIQVLFYIMTLLLLWMLKSGYSESCFGPLLIRKVQSCEHVQVIICLTLRVKSWNVLAIICLCSLLRLVRMLNRVTASVPGRQYLDFNHDKTFEYLMTWARRGWDPRAGGQQDQILTQL